MQIIKAAVLALAFVAVVVSSSVAQTAKKPVVEVLLTSYQG